MEKYNIVAIGGTGVRCLEALIHLCAVGLGPKQLFVLVIDPDASNGNIEKVKEIIAKYQKCYKVLSPSQSIFKTEITFSEESLTWSPAKQGESLSRYFAYNTLSQELKDICGLLYSQSELKLEWDKGFCGHTSIGAPVMVRINDFLKKQPWSEITKNIEQDLGISGDARLFVFASVFGATGASGFPVVARILRNRFQNKENFYIGGALVLPYFSFPVLSNQKGVFALPKDFLLKAKVALEYYSSTWDRNPSPYDAVYLVGEKTLDAKEDEENRNFAKGGPEQNNYTHYIELLAALSSLDFYQKKIKKDSLQQCAVARAKENVIEWNDLPLTDLKIQLSVFTTLAFSYRVFYYPLLTDEVLDLKKRPYLAPWYMDNFLKFGLSFDRNNLDAINEYLKTYLEWLYEVSFSTDKDLQLLDRNALKISKKTDFKKLNDEYFKSLLSSEEPECSFGYDTVWDELCKLDLFSRKKKKEIPSGIVPSETEGKFTYLLHQASKKFYEKNYIL